MGYQSRLRGIHILLRMYVSVQFSAISSASILIVCVYLDDQGMMGGVNQAPDYVQTMGLGTVTYDAVSGEASAVVTQSTKQVCYHIPPYCISCLTFPSGRK